MVSRGDESVRIQTLRLLIVDDHAVMRAGLSNMLDARRDFSVVGEADDGEAALDLLGSTPVDVVLLDLMMPGIGGLGCLEAIKSRFPGIKVIILSSSETARDINQAIGLGAEAYVAKHAQPSQLTETILAVAAGKQLPNPSLANGDFPEANRITAREMEVLNLLRSGLSNSEIGHKLGITPRTAKAHVAAILEKMNARDRTEAVARGFEWGLLRP